MREDLDFGVVKVVAGRHKGRIGYYDDDDVEGRTAIVYFGNALHTRDRYTVSLRSLVPVISADLLQRRTEIVQATSGIKGKISEARRADLLAEAMLIDNTLYTRMLDAFLTVSSQRREVFISYASVDKDFARMLAVDLANEGHAPWLDEWQIRVGESIPSKISEGIESCEFVIVVLSNEAVASRWVEREWQAKYWDEVERGAIAVLPVLLRPCEIPPLLRSKKYADFSQSYREGLVALLASIV